MIKLCESTPGRRLGLLLCVMIFSSGVSRAGDAGITYVKTIGQSSPQLAMVTGGGRLSTDEKGNLYAGTPGQNSFLQKIAPDGRVIWRADDTHCSYSATAVDDQYVYGSGVGYYGYRHLLRRKKTSGVLAPGWRYVWKTPTEVIRGARNFEYPGALLVDSTFLYVLDTGNGDLRRFDKESGDEKAFANAVKLEGATDMAFAKSGELLVLANPKIAAGEAAVAPAASVTSVDRATGAVKNPNLVVGLGRSAAIAVHPESGALFIGEGGAPEAAINKVRVFTPEGKDSGKAIGRGGEWQGKWSASAFNFASGMADIAFDPSGGFWANSFGYRMGWLGTITHFSPVFQPDKTLTAVTGSGIAVDDELNVAVGGNYKLSWNGDLLWTSGLASTGAPSQYPTTISYWIMSPIYTDAQQAIIVNVHGPAIFALDAQTGEKARPGFALPGGVAGIAHTGNTLFVISGGKVHRTTTELAPLEEYFTIPEEIVKKGVTGVAVDADGSTLYISAGAGADARLYAFKDGVALWQSKAGAVLLRHKGVLLAADAAGAGVLTLDPSDGTTTGIFGQSALEDRPALSNISGAAVGSKDGVDYLFIACQSRILVYRIETAL